MSRTKRRVNGLLAAVACSSYVQANLVFKHSKKKSMKKDNFGILVAIIVFFCLAWAIVELLNEIKHPITY